MATEKQLAAAKENVKKAQEARRRRRANGTKPKQTQSEPRSTGQGQFYRIEVRPSDQFVTFRNQDIGDKGGIERLAGKRPGGSWDTATWLVSKEVRLRGDWAVNNPHPAPSGWAFEYNNDYYPDTDDTAMVLIALRLLPLRIEDFGLRID